MKRTWLMLLTIMTAFAAVVTSTLAHTEADPFTVPLCAGSPHYYGEPGPKDPSWYWDHVTYVGGVSAWNDADSLYVTYGTPSERMHETHLAVAMWPTSDANNDGVIDIMDSDIPQTKKGNPKVGHFPYSHEKLGCVDFDPYGPISLSDLGAGPGDTLIIAAHAAMCNGETAWADCGGPDAYFRGNNWATYFTYVVQGD